ncbi:MAG: hypothetical protein HRT68_03485 [Flavobacteriaceae bacterium]|nr:hypothetical protein [Flavobacteriaceae bacterium]
MKLIKLMLLSCLLMSTVLVAQQRKMTPFEKKMTGNGLCGTGFHETCHKHSKNRMVDYLHVNTYPYYSEYTDDDQYCFRIRTHAVRSASISAVSLAAITLEVALLNEKFNEHNIFFEWDEMRYIITDDALYNNPESAFGSTHSDSDRIDIYFFNKDGFSSQVDEVGTSSEIIMSNYYLGSVVLSHEMGHLFGLFHTWHSTMPCTGFPCENQQSDGSSDGIPVNAHIPELVLRVNEPAGPCEAPSNATVAGDYVFDTHADNYHPQMHPEYTGCNPSPDDCNEEDPCFPSSSCGDANSMQYIPFTDNIMTYWSPFSCEKTFTVGQAVRMKYFIESTNPALDYLDDAMTSCTVEPDPCAGCNYNQIVSGLIDSVVPTNNNCGEYQATRPSWPFCQGDNIYINWGDGSGSNVLAVGTTSHQYPSDGTYIVTISIEVAGSICSSRGTEVEVACGPPAETCINPKVFLQGAMLNPNPGEPNWMRDDLRLAGLIPTTSPYGDGIICDPSVFTVTGKDAIVDWVFVELRDPANPTIVFDSSSALLQRDGDIVSSDGVNLMTMDLSISNVHVVIKHRNHLAVMSQVGAYDNQCKAIDFRPTTTQAGGTVTLGTNAQTTIGMPIGMRAMWAGNTNGNELVNYNGIDNDPTHTRDTVLAHPSNIFNSTFFSFQAYSDDDVNMDGIVKWSDTANLVKDNVNGHPENPCASTDPSGCSLNYQIIEQLP